MARAALEGIALQVADLLEAMAADSGAAMTVLRVDGGAAANDLLMQIQADLANVTLSRPTHLEATGIGAATLAGLGAGIWPDLAAVARTRSEDRVFRPAGDVDATTRLRQSWREAIKRA